MIKPVPGRRARGRASTRAARGRRAITVHRARTMLQALPVRRVRSRNTCARRRGPLHKTANRLLRLTSKTTTTRRPREPNLLVGTREVDRHCNLADRRVGRFHGQPAVPHDPGDPRPRSSRRRGHRRGRRSSQRQGQSSPRRGRPLVRPFSDRHRRDRDSPCRLRAATRRCPRGPGRVRWSSGLLGGWCTGDGIQTRTAIGATSARRAPRTR